jgi:hypothetical protein
MIVILPHHVDLARYETRLAKPSQPLGFLLSIPRLRHRAGLFCFCAAHSTAKIALWCEAKP